MNQDEVKALLKQGPVDILFIKNDGTGRKMTASLEPSDLEGYESKGGRKPNPDVQPVFDTEARAWRSFRWDSLQTVNGVPFEG